MPNKQLKQVVQVVQSRWSSARPRCLLGVDLAGLAQAQLPCGPVGPEQVVQGRLGVLGAAALQQREGDVSSAHGQLPHVAQLLEDGQLLVLADGQGLVELAAGVQDVRQATLNDGDVALLVEAREKSSRFLQMLFCRCQFALPDQ